MADDFTKLEKIESQQEELLNLYADTFRILTNINRDQYESKALKELDDALDPPDVIEPAKAIAVLKSILGSTSDDKMALEYFYREAGGLLKDRLKELGIEYHDFHPFLRAKGWLKSS